MKKMSKVLVSALCLVLVASSFSAALANGRGQGLTTAPGQAVNFSKGITTIITTSEEVTESVLENIVVEQSISTEQQSAIDVNEQIVSVVTDYIKHQQYDTLGHPHYRHVKERTTTTKEVVTTELTWDETTTTSVTTVTGTPVTTTVTTTTTVMHQGAPGSNGKVISEVTETNSVDVFGETYLISVHESEPIVTNGEVTERVIRKSYITTTADSDWIEDPRS